MSDAFSPPSQDVTRAEDRPMPGLMKGLSIVAIVLGVLGLGQGLLGGIGAVVTPMMTDSITAGLPSAAASAYQDVMAAQMMLLPVTALLLLFLIVAAGTMIGGGIMALTGKGVKVLGYGALGAAVYDVIGGAWSIIQHFIMSGPMQAYNEALIHSNPAAAQGAAIGGVIGVVVGAMILWGFGAFWAWSWTRIRAFAA